MSERKRIDTKSVQFRDKLSKLRVDFLTINQLDHNLKLVDKINGKNTLDNAGLEVIARYGAPDDYDRFFNKRIILKDDESNDKTLNSFIIVEKRRDKPTPPTIPEFKAPSEQPSSLLDPSNQFLVPIEFVNDEKWMTPTTQSELASISLLPNGNLSIRINVMLWDDDKKLAAACKYLRQVVDKNSNGSRPMTHLQININGPFVKRLSESIEVINENLAKDNHEV